MVGRVTNPLRKLLKRSPEKLRKRSLERLDWPRRQLGRGTTPGKMTQCRLMMKLGMASPLEVTT
jgi:hypothetical protein